MTGPGRAAVAEAEVALCPSQRSAMVYALLPEGRAALVPRIVAAASAMDGVDVIAWREADDNVVRAPGRGRAALRTGRRRCATRAAGAGAWRATWTRWTRPSRAASFVSHGLPRRAAAPPCGAHLRDLRRRAAQRRAGLGVPRLGRRGPRRRREPRLAAPQRLARQRCCSAGSTPTPATPDGWQWSITDVGMADSRALRSTLRAMSDEALAMDARLWSTRFRLGLRRSAQLDPARALLRGRRERLRRQPRDVHDLRPRGWASTTASRRWRRSSSPSPTTSYGTAAGLSATPRGRRRRSRPPRFLTVERRSVRGQPGGPRAAGGRLRRRGGSGAGDRDRGRDPVQLPGQQALELRLLRAALRGARPLPPARPAPPPHKALPRARRGERDPNALRAVTDFDKPPGAHTRTAREVQAHRRPRRQDRRGAQAVPGLVCRASSRRARGAGRSATTRATKPPKEIGQVLVDDGTGGVIEAWTGHQVAWTMARGYSGRVRPQGQLAVGVDPADAPVPRAVPHAAQALRMLHLDLPGAGRVRRLGGVLQRREHRRLASRWPTRCSPTCWRA